MRIGANTCLQRLNWLCSSSPHLWTVSFAARNHFASVVTYFCKYFLFCLLLFLFRYMDNIRYTYRLLSRVRSTSPISRWYCGILFYFKHQTRGRYAAKPIRFVNLSIYICFVNLSTYQLVHQQNAVGLTPRPTRLIRLHSPNDAFKVLIDHGIKAIQLGP